MKTVEEVVKELIGRVKNEEEITDEEYVLLIRAGYTKIGSEIRETRKEFFIDRECNVWR